MLDGLAPTAGDLRRWTCILRVENKFTMKADPGPRVGDRRPDDVIVPESLAPPAIYGITSCGRTGIKPVSTKVTGVLQELPDSGPDWGAGIRRFFFKTQSAFSSQSLFPRLSGIVRLRFYSHWDLLLFSYRI